MYREELLSKPAILVVNKMDLPDAQDKLAELKEQLEKPHGKLAGFFFVFLNYPELCVTKLWNSHPIQIIYFHTLSLMQERVKT